VEEKKVQLEMFIKERLGKEAEAIQEEDDASPNEEAMSAETKERICHGLDEAIKDYEWSRRYPELSEEDRKALRLGQEMLEKEETSAKTKRKKRGLRFYLGLAAVLVMVLAVGVVSLGGPERVIKLVKRAVGEREVVKVNSSEDNLVIVEDEERAYQIIKEEFGVDPVRILWIPNKKIVFNSMELDKFFQIAELNYSYEDEKLIYYINASYRDSSWAIDLDDKVVQEYTIEGEECLFEIKEYISGKTGGKKYSASFQYEGLEYLLIGSIEQDEFEAVINNLYFSPNMR